MSPIEALVAGGAAEAFERHLAQLFWGGYGHLVVDLSGVPAIDSVGIRALVPGYTTTQRIDGTPRLAAPPPAVARAGVTSVAWEHPKRERA
jgi:anti-anti-sigma regulatory factor